MYRRYDAPFFSFCLSEGELRIAMYKCTGESNGRINTSKRRQMVYKFAWIADNMVISTLYRIPFVSITNNGCIPTVNSLITI